MDNNIIETELELGKVYSLPNQIRIVKFKNYYLAIYTEGILWIVLQNEEELNIFNDLYNKKDLQYVFSKYSDESVQNVIIQLEAKKFEYPYTIETKDNNAYIYLTNNCNQRCKHCYMYAGDVEIEEVSVSDWIEILNKLRKAEYSGITFTGGEITVYNGFDTLIKHAHDIGFSVTILSNGIAWSQEMISSLHNYIDEIQISVDGYNEESYMNVRNSKGFLKALSTIEKFYAKGTKVSIAVTPLCDNIDEFILNFEPFAKSLLEKYPEIFIKFNHELITGRNIKITNESNLLYRKKIKALVERLYPEYYTETFVLNYENKAIRRNCGFGGISIASNGDVYWCNRIHELKSTINILTDDISEIVKLSQKVKMDTSVDNTSVCKDCEIRYICGGGCRMKYEGIKDFDNHVGEWVYFCEGKESIYEKMILSNEYFFEE